MPLRGVEFNTDRSRILQLFAEHRNFVPHWGAEVTMAVEGLEAHIERVDRFAGWEAIISTMAESGKYLAEAEAELDDLRVARVEGRSIYPVKFEAIHGDDIVINAMARHLLFQDSFMRDKWPAHTEPRFGRKVKPHRRAVRNLSHVQRAGLWQQAFESEAARELFWTGSMLSAHSNPKVKNAITAQKPTEEHAVA